MALPKLIVVGGGIKGSFIAALASLAGADVTLVERDAIGSGTSSANHGRLHAGVASWKSDTVSLMRHRYEASNLMRETLKTPSRQLPANYSFKTDKQQFEFETKCRLAGIPISKVHGDTNHAAWIGSVVTDGVFEVPDYAFSPANVAARAANIMLKFGGRLVLKEALEVEYNTSDLLLRIRGAEPINADIVVNALSSWADKLKVSIDSELPIVDRYFWSLLCVEQAKFPTTLKNILVSTNKEGNSISLVPHEKWITLDTHDTPVTRLSEEIEVERCRKLDLRKEGDEHIYRSIANLVPLFSDIEKEKISVITGLHGRLRGSAPGSVHQLFGGSKGYFVAFGGQASTSLSDAVEVISSIFHAEGSSIINLSGLLEVFQWEFERVNGPIEASMIWERQF